MTDEPRDAEEAPPWNPAMGPEPRVTVYAHGQRPMMRIRVDGQWHTTIVRSRHDWPDDRIAYHVDITIVRDDGTPGTYHRAYWWSPETMRPLPRGACVRPRRPTINDA